MHAFSPLFLGIILCSFSKAYATNEIPPYPDLSGPDLSAQQKDQLKDYVHWCVQNMSNNDVLHFIKLLTKSEASFLKKIINRERIPVYPIRMLCAVAFELRNFLPDAAKDDQIRDDEVFVQPYPDLFPSYRMREGCVSTARLLK